MYKPVQNGMNKDVRSVRYIEVAPSSRLSKSVYCFWELKTGVILPDNFRYHVLPDACVDIIFNLLDDKAATIMTPHMTSGLLDLGKRFHYVGIRLLPGVWRGALDEVVGGSVDVLRVGNVSIVDVCKKLVKNDFFAQQALLEELVDQLTLEEWVRKDSGIAKILDNLDRIHTVAEMADVMDMSPRQLQRDLKRMTGFLPHDVIKVFRLQRSFGQHYLSLYADQSHFIHSFRRITGYTPKDYKENFTV